MTIFRHYVTHSLLNRNKTTKVLKATTFWQLEYPSLVPSFWALGDSIPRIWRPSLCVALGQTAWLCGAALWSLWRLDFLLSAQSSIFSTHGFSLALSKYDMDGLLGILSEPFLCNNDGNNFRHLSGATNTCCDSSLRGER